MCNMFIQNSTEDLLCWMRYAEKDERWEDLRITDNIFRRIFVEFRQLQSRSIKWYSCVQMFDKNVISISYIRKKEYILLLLYITRSKTIKGCDITHGRNIDSKANDILWIKYYALLLSSKISHDNALYKV